MKRTEVIITKLPSGLYEVEYDGNINYLIKFQMSYNRDMDAITIWELDFLDDDLNNITSPNLRWEWEEKIMEFCRENLNELN